MSIAPARAAYNAPMKTRKVAAASIKKQVGDALREDLGDGDLTAALVDESAVVGARLLCRDDAVLCGVAWFDETFRQVDSSIKIAWRFADGDALKAGDVVCEIRGAARAILSAERTAINFLQTLSGTATVARKYVDELIACDIPSRKSPTRAKPFPDFVPRKNMQPQSAAREIIAPVYTMKFSSKKIISPRPVESKAHCVWHAKPWTIRA